MKKKGKIVLCIVLSVLVIGGAVGWSFLPHPLNYPINSIEPVGSAVELLEETEDSVTICRDGNADFKVLMFTDLHLDGKNSTSKVTVRHLVENIQKEKPDLVLLGGDNVTSGMNRMRSNQLAKIFEKLGVYWAGVIGNHEGDNPWSVSRTEMVNIFSSYDHCLMRRGPEDIDGDCNYTLRIENEDGSLRQVFYFLDTFDEMSEEVRAKYQVPDDASEYDGAHENQVRWFVSASAAIRSEYGKAPGILLMHIPLPQLASAAESEELLYGVKLEGVCSTGFDSGLFDAIQNSGDVQAVFCGHDHMNSFGVISHGVLLSYIEPSGYGSYNTGNKLGYEEKDWLQGYTALTIRPDGSFDQKQVRNSEFLEETN